MLLFCLSDRNIYLTIFNVTKFTHYIMGSRADLNDQERGVVIAMRQRGTKPGPIAVQLNIFRRTVSRVLKRFRESVNRNRKTRCGRRKKTTTRKDQALRRLALEQRFDSIGRINAPRNERIGVMTFQRMAKRCLNLMNIHSRITKKKPLISMENIV